jgi:3-hydroxyisobutyrate dehydrogenase-like beta-hydroxyacid dehydrogenase
MARASLDANRDRCHELAATGVGILTTVSALVYAAPVIMTSLPSPAAARAVDSEIASTAAPELVVGELRTFAIADKLVF